MEVHPSSSAPPSFFSSMVFLSGLRLVLGLVFAGWVMMWVVMPTNTYMLKWSPKINSDTNSTFFGSQGTNILMYTFPILFISILGCLYVHLAKKKAYNQSGGGGGHLSHAFAAMRRPLLVKGPLGILSALELTFCSMFLALLVWCFSVYVHRSFAHINPESSLGREKLWMTKLGTAAFWSGVVGNIAAAFLFFPVARMSSLLPLIGLNSEASIKYHVWIGHTVMALFATHGFGFMIEWGAQNQLSQMLKWAPVGVSLLAGFIALVCGLIMWITAIPLIRRKKFELFFYAHQLYILFIVFYVLHVGISYFCMVLPGVYLFLVDRYLRLLQSRRKVQLVSARLLPSGTIELNFAKHPGSSYTPLSIMFINVPGVSSLQWHPFTVSSNSNLEPDRLSVVIKKEGSWTQSLYNLLSSPSSPERLEVSVEGPYGPASVDFLRYESLVLVSGGSGITPFISIIREMIYRSTTLKLPTPSILLVCALKTSADLTMLDLLLPISGSASDLSHLQLKIEAYVTREAAPTPNAQVFDIQTKWFKPSPADKPIAHVLGPNNYLWLGAVIASSFVAFLSLLAIVTRYYIYPIDHNTNQIYNTSHRALLNLLIICVCIAASASAAMLWNTIDRSMDSKQIQSTDAATPTSSPSSWLFNADPELESSPHESIMRSTNVHFGARPDLKKILMGKKDANTGVMASGPSRLRRQVASICSTSSAQNLHFESISFSW